MASVNHPTASRPCIVRHLPDFKFATFLSLMAAAGQSSRIVVVADADTRSISDELLDCISSITRAKDTMKSTLHPLPNFKFLVLRTGSVKDHIKRLRQTISSSVLNAELARENQASLEADPLAQLRPMRNLETGDPIRGFPTTASAFWAMSHNDMRRICAALALPSVDRANGPVRMDLWRYTVHYDSTD